MKHYSSPVINLIYYKQTDVIRTSNLADYDKLVNDVSGKDTDVTWGGDWS